MLVELGTDGNAAIRKVRDARSRNAIENWWQEDYLRRCESLDSISASEAEEDIRDRAIGTFLGLAVGDALGTTLEFHARDAQPRLLDITGSGYFNSPTCYWTDDTAMARVLADNLVASGGLDCRDLMDRFVAWWRSGQYSCTGRCCGLGRTTRRALERYRRTQDPLAGSTDPMTAGNGSLMRLAPVALRFWNDRAQLGIAAAQQSRTTHAASEAVDACRAFADLIADTVSDQPRRDVLAPRSFDGARAVSEILGGSWRGKGRDEIHSSGYVILTLEAALWSVARTANFRDAVLLAANLADDADTVAGVTGQLAGAIYGLSGIPSRWLDQIACKQQLFDKAQKLLEPLPSIQ